MSDGTQLQTIKYVKPQQYHQVKYEISSDFKIIEYFFSLNSLKKTVFLYLG